MADSKDSRSENLNISQAELLVEIERLRPEKKVNQWVLTEEQKEFIRICRDHPRPVSFRNIAMLWEKNGWGEISKFTLRSWVIEGKL